MRSKYASSLALVGSLMALALFVIPFTAQAAFPLPLQFPEVSNVQKSTTAPSTPQTVAQAACIVTKLALDFIPYLFVIAVGAFLQGLIKYVGNGDNEEKRSEGRKMMIYGIVGFFFMVSIWSILSLFTKSFALGNATVPQFNSGGTSIKDTCASFLGNKK